jgi:hypothetical protein
VYTLDNGGLRKGMEDRKLAVRILIVEDLGNECKAEN